MRKRSKEFLPQEAFGLVGEVQTNNCYTRQGYQPNMRGSKCCGG